MPAQPRVMVERIRVGALWALGLFLVGAGVNHFLSPDFYLAIMPPLLPWHLGIVYASGVVEAAIGVALLVPRFTRAAAWSAVATFIAIFPANIYHLIAAMLDPGSLPPGMADVTLALLRLPLQFVLIGWAWLFTRPSGPVGSTTAADRPSTSTTETETASSEPV